METIMNILGIAVLGVGVGFASYRVTWLLLEWLSRRETERWERRLANGLG